ncbi:MAG: hypothetical protein EXQ60_07770 [Candidatus Nanopelagicales bacterium]|nr:hypothetical protein [Candidatus Nanopelagicales bacterium]
MEFNPLASLALTAALFCIPVTAFASELPGDPCTTENKVVALGGGSIKCTGGTWQPSQETPGGGQPGGSQSNSTIKKANNFRTVGTALSQATFSSTDQQVADVTAVRLSNGNVKLFVYVANQFIRSATSTNKNGTSFVADPTSILNGTAAGQPRAVSLGGNSMRLFYVEGGNINAAISNDGGVTFTKEGPVITGAEAGFEPGGLSVIKQGGGYRGYFSNLERPGVRAERVMRTATSTDMIHWTMGPVITGSAGTITDGGSHPFAVIDKKGKIALYYAGDRGGFYGILVSTSKNGVSFSGEKSVITGGGDPDILPAAKDTALLYYGADLGSGLGFGIKVAKSTGKVVP